MNRRTTIKRETQGLTLPFGAGGVAAVGGLLGGLAGLLVPRAMLESVAFQLYLDTIIPAAKAPLGATAQLVAAVLLAIAGAVAGYLVAWTFGITAAPGGFSGLLARLRGELAEDEEDAPPLRSADRHPDAPARRPFSAARDIPEGVGSPTIEGVAQHHFGNDDELLLDLPVVDDAVPAVDGPTRAPGLRAVPKFSPSIVDAEFEPDDAQPEGRAPIFVAGSAMGGFDLAPPTLDDWEREAFRHRAEPEPDEREQPAVEAVVEHAAVEEAVVVDEPLPPPEPVVEPAPLPVAPRITPPPLDLSAARLDELIARLEAGLTRKVAMDAAPSAEIERLDEGGDTRLADRPTPPVTPEPDPAFPHDPALAAALATLRKMNARTV